MQKRLQEIKRRWGDNSGLGFLKGATIDAERVCVCVCMCECVCMHEPPVRLCTMDVCVEMRRSGGSRPDCRNPEVVVAITGRVLHNAPGCSKSGGKDGGGGWKGACEANPASLAASCNHTGTRSAVQVASFTPLHWFSRGSSFKNCPWFRAGLAGLGSAGDQFIITRLIHPSTLMRSAWVCFQLPIDFQ